MARNMKDRMEVGGVIAARSSESTIKSAMAVFVHEGPR